MALVLWVGRADAAITMSPNPINVGNVAVGASGSATGTLDSSSNATVDLAIGACSGGLGTFTVSPNANINLNGGNTATITAEFTPDDSGTRTCTVHVYSAGTTNELGTFSIRGTGQQPPMLTVADPSNFGLLRYNNAAPLALRQSSRTVRVTNDGDGALGITNVQLGGSNAADFSFTGGTTATINGGQYQDWIVTFNPNGSSAGPRTATMTFTSNDPANGGTRTINLAGHATTAAIDTTNSIAFGIVPVGSADTRDVTITNSTGATGLNKGPLGVTAGSITVTNGPAGSWFTFTCGATQQTSCTFNPAYSITTMATVGVRCTPPSTAGTATQTADVTFTSDSDASGNNVTQVTCQAGSSVLAANTPSLDFAPMLVNDPTAVTQTFMLSNTDGTLDATFWVEITGSGSTQFTATGVGCGTSASDLCTLPAGMQTTITVTHRATVEGPIDAALRIRTTGAGPSVSLAARGVDKHLYLESTTITFPDTYRNPGDAAPREVITVANSGEYMLTVTDVAISGDSSVWGLAEPFATFTVPPGGSAPLEVKFTPVNEDEAPPGMVELTTDGGTGSISLAGSGKLRNVEMAPGSIAVGDTFAGIPTRLSVTRPGDLINVINQDSATFTIASLTIEGDDASAFTLLDVDGNEFAPVDIAPGEIRVFDVVFSPPYPGEYEATIFLYLDQDPVPQLPITVRGRAVFVGAQGGGGFGCHATGDSGAAASLLVLGVLLVVRRRRR